MAATTKKKEQIVSSLDEARHLLNSAKLLARATAAAILLVRNSVSRLILASGTESENAAYCWPNDYWPYEPSSTVVVSLNEKVDIQLARAIRVILGDFQSCTFVRVPACLGNDYTVSMALCVPSGAPVPTRATLSLLKLLAAQIAAEMREEIGALIHSPTEHLVASRMSEFLQGVRQDPKMRVALDGDLNMLACSGPFSETGGSSEQGASSGVMLYPGGRLPSSLKQLLKHTLDSGVTSPVVELSASSEGQQLHYALRATPVRALDFAGDVLDVTICRLPVVPGRPDLLAERRSNSADVSCDFLCESLIPRKSLHARNGTSYVTIRSWRSSIKKHQILALRTIKRSHPLALAARAGLELANEIKRLVGKSTFKFVVPVPCGHSADDKCLSAAIAREVAAQLGLLHISAFAHLGASGGSHPKSNTRRARLRPIQAVPGPAILIDDVATSGSHMEEAIQCLSGAGVETFAVAWIGGDARDT